MFGSEPSGPSGPSGPPFDTRPVAAACTAQTPRASKRSFQCRPPTRAVAEVRALQGRRGRGHATSQRTATGTSRPRWRAVRTTLDSTCWVSAPRRVRLPPHTLRMTTAGRIACSARQLVASIDGSRRKRNTSREFVGTKCLAKRSWRLPTAVGASISRPSRACESARGATSIDRSPGQFAVLAAGPARPGRPGGPRT